MVCIGPVIAVLLFRGEWGGWLLWPMAAAGLAGWMARWLGGRGRERECLGVCHVVSLANICLVEGSGVTD